MRRSTFAILLITAFSSMIGMGVIAPFLPVFAKQHGANGFWMGFIFAGFGISRGIIMPIVGRLSDRIGRKIFVAGGLFLFTVISLFYPLANSIFTLTIVRMVHGLAAGMIMPIVMAYVGDLAEEGKEGEFTGAVNMMFYLGLAAGPFLGGMLNHYFGFDSVFFAMSALGAVTFLIVVVFLPKDKGLEARKQEAVRSFHSLI
ncbi:MAG: MFS transporter, partial [Candidatus Omnitrophica bacterium]|nr:MFS transporter [Candidatus Omnitrophota bacterium]